MKKNNSRIIYSVMFFLGVFLILMAPNLGQRCAEGFLTGNVPDPSELPYIRDSYVASWQLVGVVWGIVGGVGVAVRKGE